MGVCVKSAGSIRHKISQIRYRHLKKRLEAELRPVPGNCAYNAVIPQPVLPTGQTHNGVPVGIPVSTGGGSPVGLGICMFGAGDLTKWKPTFCDEQVDGGLRAKKCSDFCPRRSKEQVKEAFAQELQEMSLAEVAYNYPDLAALIWVLDESDLPTLDAAEEPQEAPASEPTPSPAPVQAAVESVATSPEPREEFLPATVERKQTWWSRLLGGVWP